MLSLQKSICSFLLEFFNGLKVHLHVHTKLRDFTLTRNFKNKFWRETETLGKQLIRGCLNNNIFTSYLTASIYFWGTFI